MQAILYGGDPGTTANQIIGLVPAQWLVICTIAMSLLHAAYLANFYASQILSEPDCICMWITLNILRPPLCIPPMTFAFVGFFVLFVHFQFGVALYRITAAGQAPTLHSEQASRHR